MVVITKLSSSDLKIIFIKLLILFIKNIHIKHILKFNYNTSIADNY